MKEIRFPEIGGKLCRALPYEKGELRKFDSKASVFVKGFEKNWTHKDLFSYFQQFGDITSAKVSLSDTHLSRGYGFVLFSKEEFAQKAIESVNLIILMCFYS